MLLYFNISAKTITKLLSVSQASEDKLEVVIAKLKALQDERFAVMQRRINILTQENKYFRDELNRVQKAVGEVQFTVERADKGYSKVLGYIDVIDNKFLNQ